jgi:hypothetical protein
MSGWDAEGGLPWLKMGLRVKPEGKQKHAVVRDAKFGEVIPALGVFGRDGPDIPAFKRRSIPPARLRFADFIVAGDDAGFFRLGQ